MVGLIFLPGRSCSRDVVVRRGGIDLMRDAESRIYSVVVDSQSIRSGKLLQLTLMLAALHGSGWIFLEYRDNFCGCNYFRISGDLEASRFCCMPRL